MVRKAAVAIVIATLAAQTVTAVPLLGRQVSTKVVGGVEAQEREFPYIVSLAKGGSHFCGGTLLDANTVLTASHCLEKERNPSAITVRAGSLDRLQGGDGSRAVSMKVHPGFTGQQGLDNDVAILKINPPIKETETIKFAHLPEEGSDFQNGTVWVAGWGVTTPQSKRGLSGQGAQWPTSQAGFHPRTSQSTGSPPAQGGNLLRRQGPKPSPPQRLRRVKLKLIERSKCEAALPPGERPTITKNMICATGESPGEQKDSCYGDSGGPLVHHETGDVIGVVSWGIGCGKRGSPGVYARVSTQFGFIREASGGSPTQSPGQGQSPSGQGQSPSGQGQFPSGQGQFPSGQGQSPSGQGQFPSGQGQFPSGQGQFPSAPGQPDPVEDPFAGDQVDLSQLGAGGGDTTIFPANLVATLNEIKGKIATVPSFLKGTNNIQGVGPNVVKVTKDV